MTQPAPAVGANRSGVATAALMGICLAWGAAFTVTKGALNDVSSLLFVALRFFVATLVLWAALRWQGPLRVTSSTVRAGAVLGLALFGGYALQTVGLRYTTPSRSAFLTGLFIVIVPLLTALIHCRLPGISETVGVMVAFLGMSLLSGPIGSSQTALGDLLTIGCAVCYSLHILALGYYARIHNTRALAALQVGFTFLLSLLSFAWVEPVHLTPSWRLWLSVIFTGLFATALAFLVQTWAQRFLSATRTGLIFTMEPVFAALTAYLVLGERLQGLAAIGAFLILVAVAIVELRLLAPRKRPTPGDAA